MNRLVATMSGWCRTIAGTVEPAVTTSSRTAVARIRCPSPSGLISFNSSGQGLPGKHPMTASFAPGALMTQHPLFVLAMPMPRAAGRRRRTSRSIFTSTHRSLPEAWRLRAWCRLQVVRLDQFRRLRVAGAPVLPGRGLPGAPAPFARGGGIMTAGALSGEGRLQKLHRRRE